MDREYAYHPDDRRSHGHVSREEYPPLARYVEYIPEAYQRSPQRRFVPSIELLPPRKASSRYQTPLPRERLHAPPRPYHDEVRPMEVSSYQAPLLRRPLQPPGGFFHPDEVSSSYYQHAPQPQRHRLPQCHRLQPVSYSGYHGHHEYEHDRFVIHWTRQGYGWPDQA